MNDRASRRDLATFAALLALALSCPLPTTASAASEMLAAGDEFPAFELSDHHGNTVRSTDLAGKRYLLWFYPKAMTPGCTVEARSLRDHYAKLEQAGVVVLGVSFDEPADNRSFVEAESLPFRLLSDVKRELAMAVGAADSASAGYARRVSYLVGADGRILKAYPHVDPSTHAAEVLADCCAGAD